MEFFIAKKFQNADFHEMDAKVREELKKEGQSKRKRQRDRETETDRDRQRQRERAR